MTLKQSKDLIFQLNEKISLQSDRLRELEDILIQRNLRINGLLIQNSKLEKSLDNQKTKTRIFLKSSNLRNLQVSQLINTLENNSKSSVNSLGTTLTSH